MSEKILTEDSLEEHLRPEQPSTDPEYLAWKDAKIQKGLEQTKDRSQMIPAHEVWEKLGHEY